MQVLKNIYQHNKIDSTTKLSSLSCIRINRPCGISSVYSSSSKTTFDILTQVATIHDELCDACSLTEEYFTTQMLTTVIIAFLIIVFNTYYILGIFFGNEPIPGHHFSRAEFVTFFSYQILMHFFAVVAIVYVSSAATREVS